jgi:hypothetical protein
MRLKEISLCLSVAAALMCLIAIIPVHAAEQHDWQIKQAIGYNSQVVVEVDGWWDPNDGLAGYYRTEHIAVRWANSPVQIYENLTMYYQTSWYYESKSTPGESIDIPKTLSRASQFAQTRGHSKFRNTQTGAIFQLWTDWALIYNWG